MRGSQIEMLSPQVAAERQGSPAPRFSLPHWLQSPGHAAMATEPRKNGSSLKKEELSGTNIIKVGFVQDWLRRLTKKSPESGRRQHVGCGRLWDLSTALA